MSSIRKFLSLSASAALLFSIAGCTLEEQEDEGFFSLSGEKANIELDELIRKMQNASDPAGAFRHCQTYKMRQTITYLQDGGLVTYSVEIKYKAPDRLKTSNYKNDKAISSILIKGDKAWNIDPATGKSTEYTGKGLELVRNFAGMGRPSSNLKTIFPDIELYSVTDKNQDFYKLVCYSKGDDVAPYIFYVSKDDFLTKKLETTVYTDKGKFPYVSVSSKFKDFDRVKIATETFVTSGSFTQKYETTAFSLNEDIPDSEFELPAPWYLNAESTKAQPSSK